MPNSRPSFLTLIFTLCFLTACQPSNPPADKKKHNTSHHTAPYSELSGQTMGTTYHISFKNKDLDLKTVQQQIDDRLAQINKSMSTYDDTATIMSFNRAKAGEVIAIDQDFRQVLADSRTIYQASGGSFDPTVMPLVSLWGFGKQLTAERLQNPPTDEQIQAIKPLIGLDKVLDTEGGITKTADGVGLDFSAIAKGYGVDVAAEVLVQHGVSDYMVEIGGEVATQGLNRHGKAWTIGIDMPVLGSTTKTREILTALPLGDDHMATSGSYRNFLEYNGIRYSHTIDPTTAAPVQNSALSVTVLADSTALADGWATALSAMPMDKAVQTAAQNNLIVLFVGKNNNKYTLVQSPAFQARFGHLNLPHEK